MRATRPEAFRIQEDDERRADDEAFLFPLSLGQERIWFLNELAGAAPVFNLNTTVRIRSPVDVAALDRRWRRSPDDTSRCARVRSSTTSLPRSCCRTRRSRFKWST